MCEPCHPSPPQVGNLFSPSASPIFHDVHNNDPVCITPYRKTAHGCSFHFSSVTGYLSRDTFHLRTGRSGAIRESVPRVVFGCAHSSTGFHKDNTLGGVLSLSHLPLSLLTQLGLTGVGPPGGPLWFDRMYKSVKEQLPNMAFHFEGGAELWFTSDRLFEVHGMNARFMVAGRGYRRTVIGAAQQVNTRFTFDVPRGKLSFVSEVCE
ncbi:hypothetical protein VPH35_094463 [Triticum aestivum]